MLYPCVLSEYATIKAIERGRRSIARYGDGELNLCFDTPAKLQAPNERLKTRLVEILKENDPRCLVGIPRIAPDAPLPDRKRAFWKRYTSDNFVNLYRAEFYSSAFITRPDSIPEINHLEYWQKIFSLWKDRRVLLVEGKHANFNQCGILKNAKTVQRLACPDRDAFDHYDEIINAITYYDTDTLIILSLGPTATVAAWDLSKKGYQALDLGHLSFLHKKCFVDGLEH